MKIDENRKGKFGETGIFVRAKDGDRWTSVDIADLEKDSLLEWLKSRGGDNRWAEDVCGILMGHGHLHPTNTEEPLP